MSFGGRHGCKRGSATAKDYRAELYIDEEVVSIGLEDVRFDYDSDKWFVTIGFSRPWDRKHPLVSALTEAGRPDRSYKEICVDDDSGDVESLKVRVLGPTSTI